jgi:hypothetical protein
MPSTTPKGFPYPLGTDRLMDGDDAIHDLALAVDTKVGVIAAGLATIPAPGALNTVASVAVTLPAGRFTSTPFAVASVNSTGIGNIGAIGASVASPTSLTLAGFRSAGALNPIPCNWIAVQL